MAADGWFLVRVTGDHHQFRHPTKRGKVTIPHPVKDLPIQVVVSIDKAASICVGDGDDDDGSTLFSSRGRARGDQLWHHVP
jgi:predicted RNA binding protein YcfA (HicA-like mRNA interferase family)